MGIDIVKSINLFVRSLKSGDDYQVTTKTRYLFHNYCHRAYGLTVTPGH